MRNTHYETSELMETPATTNLECGAGFDEIFLKHVVECGIQLIGDVFYQQGAP